MLQSGQPLQCDATYTNPRTNQQLNMKVYFKGGPTNVRVEVDTSNIPSSNCPTMVSILKIKSLTRTFQDFSQYVGCSNRNIMPAPYNCAWIQTNATVDLSNVQDSGQNANNPSATSSNLQYSCISWTVDESKFQTSGNVCDGGSLGLAPR